MDWIWKALIVVAVIIVVILLFLFTIFKSTMSSITGGLSWLVSWTPFDNFEGRRVLLPNLRAVPKGGSAYVPARLPVGA